MREVSIKNERNCHPTAKRSEDRGIQTLITKWIDQGPRRTMTIVLTIFSLLFLTTSARAELIETHDANVIKAKIAELKPGDMALFDVKDILFNSSDQVMSSRHKSVYKQKFAEIEDLLGKEEAIRLKSIVLSSYKPMLVDSAIPKIISEAQKTGILAFGLTSGKTSEYGVIKNRADLRIKTLKDFGIDFSKSMDLDPIDLGDHEEVDAAENGHSIFKEGVIFASRIQKGEVLGRFLAATKLAPKKIVFVDNQLKNINFVGEKCHELGIEYLGIYFTKSAKKPITHLDKDVVDKKFEVLIKESKWLSDEEALSLVKK